MAYIEIPTSPTELLLTAIMLVGVGLIVVYAGQSRRGYFWPMLVALGLRIGAAVVHRFIILLPQGGADAVTFESRAWEWAQRGCGNLGEHLNISSSYVHSWLIANVYACTDRAPLVFQSINVALGMVTVYLVGRISEELWDRKAAVRAMWVAALFPILIINSAVPLREVWFTALFLFSMLWLVFWVKSARVIYLVVSMAGILAAGIIHGGAVFTVLAVAFVLTSWTLREVRNGALHGRVRVGVAGGGIVLISAAIVGFLAFGEMRFSSIGEIGAVMERAETLDERAASARGGSAYPGYLTPVNDLHALILTPIRMVYLLIGPPPWEIGVPAHVFGMLDGLFYLALILILARYWRAWWSRPSNRILLVVLLMLVFVFSWGVNNFGTGLRHRAKFVGLAIALGAGLLGRKRWREARVRALRRRPVQKRLRSKEAVMYPPNGSPTSRSRIL